MKTNDIFLPFDCYAEEIIKILICSQKFFNLNT